MVLNNLGDGFAFFQYCNYTHPEQLIDVDIVHLIIWLCVFLDTFVCLFHNISEPYPDYFFSIHNFYLCFHFCVCCNIFYDLRNDKPCNDNVSHLFDICLLKIQKCFFLVYIENIFSFSHKPLWAV